MRPGQEQVEAVFSALSSSTRRDILQDLASQGPATPSELGSRHAVTRQAISKHLDVLEQAGLVESTRAGRQVHYRVVPQPLEGAVSWIAEVGARWDDRLERLKNVLSD
jgi:DNA-binding transcriptional ArsR family regulator